MQTQMTTKRFIVACVIAVAGTFVTLNALAGEQIFKTTDADGNVVFTNLPPPAEQISETIDIATPNSFPPGPANGALSERQGVWIGDSEIRGAEAQAATSAYHSLTISTPGDQSNIRENAGNVAVVVDLDPALHPGHSMRLLLDNAPAATSGEQYLNFALNNVDRGTHTLVAEVLDKTGTVVFASNPSVFHLQRYSKLTAPNRPTPRP